MRSQIKTISVASEPNHYNWGSMFQLDPNHLMIVDRWGPIGGLGTYGSDGAVSICKYNIAKDSWGSFSNIISGFEPCMVGSGMIGNTIFVFFSKFFVDGTLGFIKSTDGGITWSSYTAVDVGISWTLYDCPLANVYKLGNAYHMAFNHLPASGDKTIQTFKSTDNGATWGLGDTIYSGAISYSEGNVVVIDNNRAVGIFREDGTVTPTVHQAITTNGGATWTHSATNLAGYFQPFSVYDPEFDEIVTVLTEYSTNVLSVTRCSVVNVFSSSQLWETPQVMPTNSCNPSINPDANIEHLQSPMMVKLGFNTYYSVFHNNMDASTQLIGGPLNMDHSFHNFSGVSSIRGSSSLKI